MGIPFACRECVSTQSCKGCKVLNLSGVDNFTLPRHSKTWLTVTVKSLADAWNVLNSYNVWDCVTMRESGFGKCHKWLKPLPKRDYEPLADYVGTACFIAGYLEVHLHMVHHDASGLDTPCMTFRNSGAKARADLDPAFIRRVLSLFDL